MFPTITHINDVLPAISGRQEFVVGTRANYKFIDYNYAEPDTFDCSIRRECRGLKFDLDGNLIARPLHKFFNLHEKPNEVPDFNKFHVIAEKLDGSMIHAAQLDNNTVFMTRAGISDQAVAAHDFIRNRAEYGQRLLDFCAMCAVGGYTPIFEYTAPNNQIVVKYLEENLTLIAVRGLNRGKYLSQFLVDCFSREYRLPVVKTFVNTNQDLQSFVAHTKGLVDLEGYVIRDEFDRFIKLKADAYVLAHRAKSGLLWEKDVLRTVLEDKVDDLLGLLAPDEARQLEDWSDLVRVRMQIYANEIFKTMDQINSFAADWPRSDWAKQISMAYSDTQDRSLCFSHLDGKDMVASMRAQALKACSNTAKAREYLQRLGVHPWKPFMFAKIADM